MKKILKTITGHPAGQWPLAGVVALYIVLIWFTARVRLRNVHYPNSFWEKGKPVIVAVWHGRLLMAPFLFPNRRDVCALISQSRDGQIISKVARLLRMATVSGSSSKGGAAAVREMVRRAGAGQNIFITPDGPRGPRMSLSRGTVELARLTELPVVPVGISVRHGRCVNSWDRFLLPRLFSEILVEWGEPLALAKSAGKNERDRFARGLEERLRGLQQKADNTLGRVEQILPARLERAR